jgi:hypothetical protein
MNDNNPEVSVLSVNDSFINHARENKGISKRDKEVLRAWRSSLTSAEKSKFTQSYQMNL